MIFEKGDLKMCLSIQIVGDSSIRIAPINIHENIWKYPNSVLYLTNNNYAFEKRHYDIKYTMYRLIIPPYIDINKSKITDDYTFIDDQVRYNFLKKLKNDLVEFSKSGFFGYNPNAHIMMYKDFWFLY